MGKSRIQSPLKIETYKLLKKKFSNLFLRRFEQSQKKNETWCMLHKLSSVQLFTVKGGLDKIKTLQTERQEEGLFIILYMYFAKMKFLSCKGLYIEKH